MSLREYQRKRDFQKSAEPEAGPGRQGENRFVIQKHAASRLHYDFRLEMDGVLKSWAVPKGIPFAKGEKHLAVHVEDHPVDYLNFEGTISKGQYGGGTVMVWDQGTFSTAAKAPARELESGKLHFTLNGKKLHGEWHLVRLRGGDQWLLIKGGEDLKPVSHKQDDVSALSGKTMQQLSQNGETWESKPRPPKNRFAEKIRKRIRDRAALAHFDTAVQRGSVSRSVARTSARFSLFHRPAGWSSRGGSQTRAPNHSTAPAWKFIEPMKARLAESPPVSPDWIYEIKFDGYRALAFKEDGHVALFSRNEKDFGEKFPEVAEAISTLPARQAVIDGEIVALDKHGVSSFQLLQGFEIGEQRPPLCFYAFDLLQLNGDDLREQTILQRKEQLASLLQGAPEPIRFSGSLGENAKKLLKQAAKLGLEGLIGKRKDSRYEAGKRSGAWIKLKLSREQEFVIGGYSDPAGSRQHFGAVLVGYYERGRLRFCGKVGTGFDIRLLASLASKFEKIRRDDCPFINLPEARGSRYSPGLTAREMKKCHWLEPGLVCQIKFSEWTQDGKLRQPVFLGLREDKDALDVVRETPR